MTKSAFPLFPPPPVPAGDQIEVIEGVNAPALGKSVADHIPEGMLDIEDEKDEEGADEDGDDY